ncbi:MAG: hypothetical protein EAY75_10270 [Bacteroidetes bacterium]|nr:MAG: hypothetical protein EAY75_10270 [Bacteroidota bacterium]
MLQKPMHSLLKKIINSGIGPGRFAMATVGMGVAVLLILLAVQLYANFTQLLHGKNNSNNVADFLVINKTVTGEMQGQKEKSTFTPADIADLKAQPFTEGIGVLSSTNFSVSVQSYSDALPFYSDAYFESVPDEFIDGNTANWSWKPGQRDLPVIIPAFFLDLYNTGMAMTQDNLPQLSMEAIMAIPIKITVKGKGQTAEFVGHVAAQTDRLNSILIPQSFMDWANEQYGYRKSQLPTRVVVKTKDPSSPALVQYLAQKGWKTNAEKTRFSKIRGVVNVVVSALGGFGLLMLLFGLLVFSLFIQLTIAACKPDITLLQTLGTAPSQLHSFLMRRFMPTNLALLGVALVVLAGLQVAAARLLQAKQILLSPWLSWQTLVAAALVMLAIWWVNSSTVSKHLAMAQPQ